MTMTENDKIVARVIARRIAGKPIPPPEEFTYTGNITVTEFGKLVEKHINEIYLRISELEARLEQNENEDLSKKQNTSEI